MPLYNSPMQVILFLASKSDAEFIKPAEDLIKEFGVTAKTVMASAHKVPEKVIEIVEQLNSEKVPTVVITVVGMSNGLGGVVAGSCVHPVINCPPYKDLPEYLTDIHSNLRMPSDVPVMTVLNQKNAALCALRILGESDAALKAKVMKRIEKVKAEY